MSESEETTSVNNESSPAVGGSVEQVGSDGLLEGRRYFCKICDIGFSTFPSLKDHLGSSHTVKITSRLFFCQSCEESFRFQQSFNIHLHKVHTAETVDTCIKCGFKLPHERTIPTRQSGEPHPEHYCIVCQAEMSASKREAKKTEAIKTQSDGGTKTQSDGKDAGKRTELKNGGTKKTFTCELCHSRYSTSYNLNNHLLAKHGVRGEDKPHHCGICQRGFSHMRDMRVHLQRVHVEAETKPHACDACGKAFTSENQLLRHSRLHDRERCDVCLKVVSSSYMLIHMRTHLNIKPYACILCDKSFAVKDRLKEHVRTHTGEKPHICETCGRAFTLWQHLKTHLRVHTGEKPYVCDVCQRGFSQKWVMVAHRRIHTGERPFECEVCQRGFIYKSQLKTHQLTHVKSELVN